MTWWLVAAAGIFGIAAVGLNSLLRTGAMGAQVVHRPVNYARPYGDGLRERVLKSQYRACSHNAPVESLD